MSRACTICIHADRGLIDRALIEATPLRTIADRHGVSKTSLIRHKADHLAADLAAAGGIIIPDDLDQKPDRTAARRTTETDQPDHGSAARAHATERRQADERRAIDVLADLERQLERINRLSDAVDTWLRDPEDPERYAIGPRGEEMDVVYLDWVDVTPRGQPKRKRATLAQLLARIEGSANLEVSRVSWRYPDRAELLLKTSEALKNQHMLLITALEKLYAAQETERFMATVLAAIGEADPDVRARIERALRLRLTDTGPPLPPGG